MSNIQKVVDIVEICADAQAGDGENQQKGQEFHFERSERDWGHQELSTLLSEATEYFGHLICLTLGQYKSQWPSP